jgi:O-acetyl-ADP-ribose deacetylase (regulator of RNase III)
MTISNIFDDAILLGTLAGLIGSCGVLWANSRSLRIISALLFSLLMPTLVFAILRAVHQEKVNITLFGSVAVAAVSTVFLAVGTVGYVSKADIRSEDVGASAIPRSQYESLREQYESLRDQQEAKRPLSPARVAAKFQLPDDDRRHLLFVQGAISDILGRIVSPDVVVNSENDYMMLGRPFDKNVSGALRDMDAVKDQGHHITLDALYESLQERLVGQHLPVRLGAVFETKTTGLRSRGVKYIFHIATVQPAARGGFTLNHSQLSALFPDFIKNCFRKFNDLLYEGDDMSSILFPLIGAGDGGVSSRDSATWMVNAILDQMQAYGGIREVFIVAFRRSDLQALLEAAKAHNLGIPEGFKTDLNPEMTAM